MLCSRPQGLTLGVTNLVLQTYVLSVLECFEAALSSVLLIGVKCTKSNENEASRFIRKTSIFNVMNFRSCILVEIIGGM